MIDTTQLEQRSEEWRLARTGSVTASRVADLIKMNKNGSFSAKRAAYFNELVAERITKRPQDWKEIRSLTERAELEPDARACYTFYTGLEVDVVGYVKHPTIENAGASPDGLIGTDGMLEIKCLDAANHVRLLSGDDSVMFDYLPQVHFGMACTGRLWCDFVAFNPTMPEDMKLYRRRIPRDKDCITGLEAAVKQFLSEVDARVKEILSFRVGANNHLAQESEPGVVKAKKVSARN